MVGKGSNRAHGQLSVEMIVVLAAMVMLLLSIYVLNQHLSLQWEEQRQSLEASAAARKVAIAINQAWVGGNGTQITFYNSAGPTVTRISIAYSRTVRAYYSLGGYSSYPLVTGSTNMTDLPLNSTIAIRNINNVIYAEAA